MLEKMKEIIADQLSVEVENVTEASSFKEDLGAAFLLCFSFLLFYALILQIADNIPYGF